MEPKEPKCCSPGSFTCLEKKGFLSGILKSKKKYDLGSEDFPEHLLEEESGPAGPAVLLGPVRFQRARQLALDLNQLSLN
jgi:hypothetical protein